MTSIVSVSQKGDLPSGRLRHTSCIVKNRIFLFGGKQVPSKEAAGLVASRQAFVADILPDLSLFWEPLEENDSNSEVLAAFDAFPMDMQATVVDLTHIHVTGEGGHWVLNTEDLTWEKGSEGFDRSGHTTFYANGKLFALGGRVGGGDLTNSLICYQPESRSWELQNVAGKEPAPFRFHAICHIEHESSGSTVIVFGGQDSEGMYLQNCCQLSWDHLSSSGWSWKMLQNSGIPRARAWATFSAITADRLLLYGGYSGYDAKAERCKILDLSMGTWSDATEFSPSMMQQHLPDVMYGHTAHLVQKSMLLLIDGYNGKSISKSVFALQTLPSAQAERSVAMAKSNLEGLLSAEMLKSKQLMEENSRLQQEVETIRAQSSVLEAQVQDSKVQWESQSRAALSLRTRLQDEIKHNNELQLRVDTLQRSMDALKESHIAVEYRTMARKCQHKDRVIRGLESQIDCLETELKMAVKRAMEAEEKPGARKENRVPPQ